MSASEEGCLYVARLVVDVPIRTGPGKLRHKKVDADTMALWEAENACGWIGGEDLRRLMEEAGGKAIVGMRANVENVRRLGEKIDLSAAADAAEG